jgi:hypothetical protein
MKIKVIYFVNIYMFVGLGRCYSLESTEEIFLMHIHKECIILFV